MKKGEIVRVISDILSKRDEILFAYIFGSFIVQEDYKDIDIGIYLKNFEDIDPLKYELSLERELEDKVKIPFDVRVINNAPLGFIYNVIKEKIIVLDRDDDFRADFESIILREYFDYKHLIMEYLKELKNAPI
ncbi:MAG: type VII toxin-antitoxin system MntA family adenylyltransferase antitoxin [Dictyoglomaceae bacterium]